MEKLPVVLDSYEDKIHVFADTIEKEWPEWDYHNFLGHGLETFDAFVDLVEYVSANGLTISEDEIVAGVLSALEHDAGNQWGAAFLYDYPEERSAAVGSGLAKVLGFSPTIIERKQAATLATRPGSKCVSLLDKMIRRADIANLAWEYDSFRYKTVAFWRETQKQSNAPISFKEWLPKAAVPIMLLLDDDLLLGDFDRGVNCQTKFHDLAFANFQRLHDEVEKPEYIEPELYLAA